MWAYAVDYAYNYSCIEPQREHKSAARRGVTTELLDGAIAGALIVESYMHDILELVDRGLTAELQD